MDTQNVTLSLPRPLLRRVRIAAAKRDTSISALLAASLEDLVRRDEDREVATQRFLARARSGYDMGSQGRLSLSRDELHDR